MVFQLFDTQYVEDGVLYLLYVAVALLRGGAWIEISTCRWVAPTTLPSHSFAGVRGLKCYGIRRALLHLVVALLRGGAWIEIMVAPDDDVFPFSRRTPSRGCVD